jgi:hypothetical protein
MLSLTATFRWLLHNLRPYHLMGVFHIMWCLIRHVTCVSPFIIHLCVMLTYPTDVCQMPVCLSEICSLRLSQLVSMWSCAFLLHVSLTHGSASQCPCLGCNMHTTFQPIIRTENILHSNVNSHTPPTATEIRQKIGTKIPRQSAMGRPSAICHCNHIIFRE